MAARQREVFNVDIYLSRAIVTHFQADYNML